MRRASEKDLDALYRFYERVTKGKELDPDGPLWNTGVYPSWKDLETDIARNWLWVQSEGDAVDGSIVLIPEQEKLSIHLFAVHPEKRKRGIARAMLKEAENLARNAGYEKMVLDVVRTNQKARSLYEKNGYVFQYDFSRMEELPEPIAFSYYEKKL